MGLCSYLKVTAAFRILWYGIAFDAVHETLGMLKNTAEACMLRFCDSVVELCSPQNTFTSLLRIISLSY